MFSHTVIHSYIVLTGLGVLGFWGLAFRGHVRDTARAARTAAGTRHPVHPVRKAA